MALGVVGGWSQQEWVDVASNERRHDQREVDDRIEVLQSAGLEDGQEVSGPGAAVLAGDEEPILTSEGDGALLPLSGIVVEREPAVGDEAFQGRPVVAQVAGRLGEFGFGGDDGVGTNVMVPLVVRAGSMLAGVLYSYQQPGGQAGQGR